MGNAKTTSDVLGAMKKEFTALLDPHYHKAKEASGSGRLKHVVESNAGGFKTDPQGKVGEKNWLIAFK